MEASVITKANALKAAQFLFNLDASNSNERYQEVARHGVQHVIQAKGVVEKDRHVKVVASELTKPRLKRQRIELADHTNDLSKRLT